MDEGTNLKILVWDFIYFYSFNKGNNKIKCWYCLNLFTNVDMYITHQCFKGNPVRWTAKLAPYQNIKYQCEPCHCTFKSYIEKIKHYNEKH